MNQVPRCPQKFGAILVALVAVLVTAAAPIYKIGGSKAEVVTKVQKGGIDRKSLRNIEAIETTSLSPFSVSQDTGEKPQSKVWRHDDRAWAVMPSTAPSESGTWIWRLETDNTWTAVLRISTDTGTKADVKKVGDIAHILLWDGTSTELVSVEYVQASTNYQLWTQRATATPIALSGSETATIDIDSTGRMWLAADSNTDVVVYHSETPYTTFSGPITLASGTNSDDIAAVIALPGDKVGVMWSNQAAERFGFKIRNDEDLPEVWSAEEFAASGNNVADDHINLKATADGTLYAAVKTSYDSAGQPAIAMLVRRPDGQWDDLYPVSDSGTRGIVILNEIEETLRVIYASSEGSGNIVYRESPLGKIAFAPAATLISGSLNNPTSAKENWTDKVVVIAEGSSQARGVELGSVPGPGGGSLVGHWRMDEGGGPELIDISGYENNATINGAPIWDTDAKGGLSLFLGSGDHGAVADNESLDISTAITMAAWIKPSGVADTQYVLKKSTQGAIDGYELSLASSGKVFVRFNQDTSGNTYRIDSTTDYPTSSSEWMHIAATYDGSTIRLFINGVEEISAPGPTSIALNDLPLGIGAQGDGFSNFRGRLDDVRLYNVALPASEILSLATNQPATVDAGEPQEVSFPAAATLAGSATDDGNPFGTLVTNWSKISGPGTVSFSNPSAAATTATFSASGVYVLRLTADDGSLQHWDETVVTVVGTGPTLLGHWTMEDGSGTVIHDESGNSNDGSVGSTDPQFVSPGRVGVFALHFDGNDAVTVPDSPTLNPTSSITIALWVRPNRAGTQHIFKKGTGTSGDTLSYEISLSSTGASNGSERIFGRFRIGGTDYRVNADTQYPKNGMDWMHAAATYDGSSVKLYINGVLEDEIAASGDINIVGTPLSIGAQNGTSEFLEGSMDDIRLYGTALSPEEIAALANPAAENIPPVVDAGTDQVIYLPGAANLQGVVSDDGLPEPGSLAIEWSVTSGPGSVTFGDASQPVTTASFSVVGTYILKLTADDGEFVADDEVQIEVLPPVILPDPIGYWPMDEGAGSSILDQSGNGHDGALAGNPTWNADRINGPYSLNLDGTGDCALVDDAPGIRLTESIAIAAWVRPSATRTQYILRKGIQNGANPGGSGYELSLASSGTAFFRFNQTIPGNTYRIDSNAPLAVGVWTHLVGTWDGTTMRLYVNGVEQSATQGFTGTIYANSLPLGIGCQSNGGSVLNGRLDDVYLFGEALSPVMIQRLYANRSPEQPIDPTPEDGAEGVATSPQLTVSVSDPNADQLSVEFYGRPAPGGLSKKIDDEARFLGTSFDHIGTVEEVAAGGSASLQWVGLMAETEYEWYVVIDDGLTRTTGPLWSFTTLAPTSAPTVVSGQVLDVNRRPIGRVRVSVSNLATGETRTAISSPFGYFAIDGIRTGETYMVTAAAKGRTFNQEVILVNDRITDLEIIER